MLGVFRNLHSYALLCDNENIVAHNSDFPYVKCNYDIL